MINPNIRNTIAKMKYIQIPENAVKLIEVIALDNPEYLNSVIAYVTEPDWQNIAVNLIRSDQFIQAVKLVRDRTGKSLRECKDYCDNIKNGIPNPPLL